MLLYDCDTGKEDEQVGEDERLWIRSIKQNTENTKMKKGIENLFPIKFFEEEFEFRKEYYSKKPKDDGGHVENLDKPKFCDWICENGSKVDFAKFDSVVKILKKFVEAHQSHAIEQPTTE